MAGLGHQSLFAGWIRAIALTAHPLVLILGPVSVSAQSPEEVLVVVNADSDASRRIGDYYTEKRRVPSPNLCRIRASTTETVDWPAYQQTIEEPVARCLSELKASTPIRFIATTLGVPMRITGRGKGQSSEGASVDSELALLYAKQHGAKFDRSGVVPNPFFGRRDSPFSQEEFPIYLVTRLAAYDVDTVFRMIDQSLKARNQGKVVVDMRGSDDSGGDQALADTAIFLPDDRALLDQTAKVVSDERDVIGYASWGSNDPARTRRRTGFHWLPGAAVLEFVSTDARTLERPPPTWELGTWSNRTGWYAGSPQSLSADYLDEGATAAAGHVDEPYLQNTARPEYFFTAYLKGRTLAESYYLAIPSLSWQNVIFGDPLCRLLPTK